jgi:hypothetical protein
MNNKKDLTVDGLAVPRTTVVVPEPSLSYEYNELKRKLERKAIELKRKDKEIIGLQRDVNRLNELINVSSTECRSLLERNEKLQESLIGQYSHAYYSVRRFLSLISNTLQK